VDRSRCERFADDSMILLLHLGDTFGLGAEIDLSRWIDAAPV
jgi:hypothetical protein